MGTTSATSSLSSAAAGTSSFNAQQYVAQLIASEQGPEQLMQQQVSTLSDQSTALGTLSTQMTTLQNAVFALNDFQGALAAKQATSSNDAVATATADATATAGSHTLTVSSLATTSSAYSNTLADGNTTFATGSFQVQVGAAAPVTVTVDSSNNTLTGVANSLNALNAGFSASVVTDASGARLSLVSGSSGAPGDLTISNNTTGLTLTKSVTGANAAFTLDGISLQSASNTATGILPGVTIDLAGASASPVTLTVAPDTGQATTAIQSFVTAYNAVIGTLNQQFTYDPTTQTTGPLGSDTMVMQIQQQMLSDAAFAVPGNGAFTNLAAVGVDMNSDGTLSVNSATLSASMAANYSGVQNFFQQASPSGFAANFSNDITNITDPTQGPIAVDQQGIQQTTTSLNQAIADFQANLNSQQQQLLQVYSQVAVTLQQMPNTLNSINSQLSSLSTSKSSGG
ncbi:MAG TPA: flagellar filament capping protein FliD [Terriglobales bacterium]|nr:flagellar filament capping protein FliD [Terriglobales bacterium]